MIPEKLQKRLQQKLFPQRVLLVGDQNALQTCVQTAATLQKVSEKDIAAGTHPDTVVLEDVGATFAIGEDQNPEWGTARWLIHWAHQCPTSAHRIIILQNIERASGASMSCLLKLIEEPPPRAVLLFTTRNALQMMPTILSRMTVIRTEHQEQDFEISDEVRVFFDGKSVIPKFRSIETLNKRIKDEGRSIGKDFVEELITHARFFPQYRKHLELLFQTHGAISGGGNIRLTLERLALGVTKG